jgi:hypothetical protein
MVALFAKHSAQNDLRNCLLSKIKQRRVSQREREREREKIELVPFWTADVRSLVGVFTLRTFSGTWLERLSLCAFLCGNFQEHGWKG